MSIQRTVPGCHSGRIWRYATLTGGHPHRRRTLPDRVGTLVWLGAFRWFGRLPGDIRIERPGVTVFIPLGSMLVISVLLSLGAAAVRALLMRK
jgi:hypothetical protein